MPKNRNKAKNGDFSQIPYAQRLQIRKSAEIRAAKEEALSIVMRISYVALNDTEGMGFLSLNRFAKRLAELVTEYYTDPEVQDVHLNQRLEEMGFIIDNGRILSAVDSDGNRVKAKAIKGEK